MSDPVTLSTGAMLLRVGLALGLVLGLLAGVLYLYRRGARRSSAAGRRQRIEIIAQRSLTPRTSLALVEVAGETLLIGITPQQISALRRIGRPPAAEPERVAAELEAATGATLSPAAIELPAAGSLALSARGESAEPRESPFEATLRSEVHRVGRHLAAVLAGEGGARRAAPGGEA